MTRLQSDDDALYQRIGAFLAEHGLPPSPGNYALAHQLFADEDAPAARAVKAATADGVRLTQCEADGIMTAHAVPGGGRSSGVDPAVLGAAKRQIEAFAEIVESTRAQAQTYGRDLAQGAAELEQSGGSAETLIAITRTMIERTQAAEQQLTAARDEAQTLRVKLAEAGQEARRDPLTGLPNRRAFEEHHAGLEQAGGLISLAICDIDHFKRVNDTYGHGVGDRVLKMVADLLNECCSGHFVARLGGEEFVAVFDGLNAAEGAAILDEAREQLAAKRLKVRETDAPLGQISFSAGVACGTSASADVPLARADALLYQAKDAGRNRVLFEGGPDET
ncbi:MAG: GGDEF domain-containing protein [Sphingomonas sp.]|nr:GGDEF domain-containing protein [Sphingomonas sp.]